MMGDDGTPWKIRALCLEILENCHRPPAAPLRPDADPILALLDELRSAHARDPSVVRHVAEFVSYPLLLHFSLDAPSSIAIERALECLAFVFRNADLRFIGPRNFHDALSRLPSVVSHGRATKAAVFSPNSASAAQSVSEEVKILAITCLCDMVSSIQSSEQEDIIPAAAVAGRSQEKFVEMVAVNPPLVAHLIGTVLETAEKSRNTKLRILALKTVTAWCRFIQDADIIAMFLPGIVSAIGRLIIGGGDSTLSGGLLAQACASLADVVCQVVSDSSLAWSADQSIQNLTVALLSTKVSLEAPPGPSSSTALVTDGVGPEPMNSQSRVPPAAQRLDRSKEWVETVAGKLKPIFEVIFTRRGHQSEPARLAFINLCLRILTECSTSLQSCAPLMLETVISFLDDDLPTVRLECRRCVRALAALDSVKLQSTVLGNFEKSLFDLPKTLTSATDDAKLQSLKILVGYLLILGTSVHGTLQGSFEYIVDDLLTALAFSKGDLALIEDRAVPLSGSSREVAVIVKDDVIPAADGSSAISYTTSMSLSDDRYRQEVPLTYPPKRFKNIRGPATAAALCRVLRLLAHFGDRQLLYSVLSQRLMDTGRAETDLRSEALFCLTEFCLGLGEDAVEALDGDVEDTFVEEGSKARSCELNEESAMLVINFIEECMAMELLSTVTTISSSNTLASSSLLPSSTTKTTTAVKAAPAAAGSTGMTVARTAMSAPQPPTLAQLHSNITLTCLALEAIGSAATILGPLFDSLGNLTQQALHAVTSHLANPSRPIATSALLTLRRMTPTGTVKDLIVSNVDYIVNEASRCLRDPHGVGGVSLLRACGVLVAVLEVGGNAVLGFLEDVVDDVVDAVDLVWSVGGGGQDVDGETVLGALFRVLGAVVESGAASAGLIGGDDAALPALPDLSRGGRPRVVGGARRATEDGEGEDEERRKKLEALVPEWVPEGGRKGYMRFLRWKAQTADILEERLSHPGMPFADAVKAEGAGKDDDAGGAEAGKEEEDDELEEARRRGGRKVGIFKNDSVQRRVAVKVMDKAQHFMSGRSAEFRKLVMSVVARCVPVLKVSEDTPDNLTKDGTRRFNDMNPGIYRLWPLVLRRLTDREHFVILEALRTVRVFVASSPDFMRAKIMEDLMPKLRGVMDALVEQRRREVGMTTDGRALERRKGPYRRDLVTVVSTAAGSVSTTRQSPSVQLQAATLETVCHLVEGLELPGRELRKVVESVWGFTDPRLFPDAAIRGLATKVLDAVAAHDSNLVWLAITCAKAGSRGGRMVLRPPTDGIMKDPLFADLQPKTLTVPQWMGRKFAGGTYVMADHDAYDAPQ